MMSKVQFDVAISLDGYLAGPNPRFEEPLGDGGEKVHEWMLRTATWAREHGGGGEGGATDRDDEIVRERTENVGAYIMGREMFGGGPGGWDESWKGWWGDNPPYHVPVFVLTHHPREPLPMEGGTTFHFVTDGIDSALEQAKAAAGDRDVQISGGADVIQQYLRAGAVDEFQLHIAPILLGGGVRLLDGLGNDEIKIEVVRAVESPYVTHVKYRVL
jgi:dihydrofolate reductase